MDDSLQRIVNQLPTADNPALLNSFSDSLSALRLQLPVTQFLATVHAAQLSSDQFVSLVYVTMKSASAEWLVPQLDHEGAADGTCERAYSNLSAALCKHACMRSLASEEETCGDLSKKLGKNTGVACTAMMTFSQLLSSLSCHNSCRQQKECKRMVQRVIRTLSCSALVICLEHEQGCRWTTTRSVECAKHLMSDICSANSCEALESLLSTNDGKFGLLQHVLNDVLPKLTRTKWKLNPAAAHVFRRCLMVTQQPLLSDCLTMFLPPTLLFIDDFEACTLL